MHSSSPTRIPNRFVLLWTGRNFPLYGRLAVESLLQADATCEIEIHLFGEEPYGSPEFWPLQGRDRITLLRVDEERAFDGTGELAPRLRALYARIPVSARSARSNLLRYAILHARGGIYVDFDILALRDMKHLLHLAAFVGEEQVWRVDEARVAGRREAWMVGPTVAYVAAYLTHRFVARLGLPPQSERSWAKLLDARWSGPNLNNAVLGAEKGSTWMLRLLSAALDASPTERFALGPTLVSRVWKEGDTDVVRLPAETFFFVPPSYSFRFFEGAPPAVPAGALLLHYVNSNHTSHLASLSLARLAEQREGALFYRVAFNVAERAGMLRGWAAAHLRRRPATAPVAARQPA